MGERHPPPSVSRQVARRCVPVHTGTALQLPGADRQSRRRLWYWESSSGKWGLLEGETDPFPSDSIRTPTQPSTPLTEPLGRLPNTPLRLALASGIIPVSPHTASVNLPQCLCLPCAPHWISLLPLSTPCSPELNASSSSVTSPDPSISTDCSPLASQPPSTFCLFGHLPWSPSYQKYFCAPRFQAIRFQAWDARCLPCVCTPRSF